MRLRWLSTGLSGLVVVVAAAFLGTASAPASTPAASTVTVPTSAGVTVTDSWTGSVLPGVNPASDCAPASSSPTDEHAVTIHVAPGTYDTVNAAFTFTITWTPASGSTTTSDLILTVVGPDGNEIDSSDGSDPAESVSATNLAAGTYRVIVCSFANTTTQPYDAKLSITTSSASGPAPIVTLPGPGKKWGAPVKITPTNGYGYEPALLIDKYGNAFATAHKENWQIPLAPDPNSPQLSRSMSWIWLSVDQGQSWIDPPGLTLLSLEQREVGDEGDLGYDDAGHIYFVDTYAGDITLTRWTTNGLGQVLFDFNRPIIPTPEADDRPWVAAHGDGHVFYFANMGNKSYNGGRYTVHASYDGGLTFDSVGVGLPDSGWCRPAADHEAGSPYVYAACTNDNGTLYSYVSADDGRSFQRYTIGTYNNDDGSQSWPTIQVGPDGSVWVLYVDSTDVGSGGVPNTNRLFLFHSTTHGKTWTRQEMTPVRGRYEYAWLSLTPDGKKMGMGVYYRSNNSLPWLVAGATWATGGKIRTSDFVSLDPDHPAAPAENSDAPGDLMGSYFFPNGKLGVVWTRYVLWTDVATLERDIYFAKQR
jgi:hypothetical protein